MIMTLTYHCFCSCFLIFVNAQRLSSHLIPESFIDFRTARITRLQVRMTSLPYYSTFHSKYKSNWKTQVFAIMDCLRGRISGYLKKYLIILWTGIDYFLLCHDTCLSIEVSRFFINILVVWLCVHCLCQGNSKLPSWVPASIFGILGVNFNNLLAYLSTCGLSTNCP